MIKESAKYCPICGTALEPRACKGEPHDIPYCPQCQDYRFDTFDVAISTAIFNPDHTKVLMMRQYGREKYNFLAGYINKGESAEQALVREMEEEMHMKPIKTQFICTGYFAKTNVLMIHFLTQVDSEDLSGMAKEEVDVAEWLTYEEAVAKVIPGGQAERLVHLLKDQFATK